MSLIRRRVRRVLIGVSVTVAAAAIAAEPPFAVSPPATLADLDLGRMKGTFTCLAWSGTGDHFYLQTVEDGPTTRHYVVRAGSPPQSVDAQPDWASTYWSWKSTRYVPGHRDMLIQVDSRNDLNQIPSQSLRDKAKGDASPRTDSAIAGRGLAESGIGAVTVRTLVLNGEVIGEYVNAPLVPGMTFGWSPEPLHAVAYVPHSGRLMLMDVLSGAKQEVPATSNVLLPAWSPDGSRIVFLQKTGRKTFALMRVNVTRR